MKNIPASLTLLVLFVLLHLVAVHFYFYWMIWWYDIMMHVLGGLIAAFIVLTSFAGRLTSKGKMFIAALVGSLAVGILWEVFEYKTGLTYTSAGNYVFDTTSDLLCDISGGLIAYLLHTNGPKA